jgi:Phosphoserine phosphatase
VPLTLRAPSHGHRLQLGESNQVVVGLERRGPDPLSHSVPGSGRDLELRGSLSVGAGPPPTRTSIGAVNASLDLYLVPWATERGFDAVLATELEFVNGRFSGCLAIPNCWGKEKARRLEVWLSNRHPTLLYAYGDSRGDRHMFALAIGGGNPLTAR